MAEKKYCVSFYFDIRQFLNSVPLMSVRQTLVWKNVPKAAFIRLQPSRWQSLVQTAAAPKIITYLHALSKANFIAFLQFSKVVIENYNNFSIRPDREIDTLTRWRLSDTISVYCCIINCLSWQSAFSQSCVSFIVNLIELIDVDQLGGSSADANFPISVVDGNTKAATQVRGLYSGSLAGTQH